jgi:tRNA threonylcarbamoyladenosine modification (KEOPS) complex Cgi121 subunit
MGAVFEARKVNHAINAGKRGTAAAASVRIEFLLGENVSAALTLKGNHDCELTWLGVANGDVVVVVVGWRVLAGLPEGRLWVVRGI